VKPQRSRREPDLGLEAEVVVEDGGRDAEGSQIGVRMSDMFNEIKRVGVGGWLWWVFCETMPFTQFLGSLYTMGEIGTETFLHPRRLDPT
jgi:hypothetical protein